MRKEKERKRKRQRKRKREREREREREKPVKSAVQLDCSQDHLPSFVHSSIELNQQN